VAHSRYARDQAARYQDLSPFSATGAFRSTDADAICAVLVEANLALIAGSF
jgi:hypothetical protein